MKKIRKRTSISVNIPALPGAHTQAETLDELHKNLEEVAALCLEELTGKDPLTST